MSIAVSLIGALAVGFVNPATGLAYGKRIDGPTGIAVLESPAEIARRRVAGELRPWGYGSGIEDLNYQNGMFLYALLDAEEATGDHTSPRPPGVPSQGSGA